MLPVLNKALPEQCSVFTTRSRAALKCKTLGGILRCRLWMQTNALSRQVVLLAEPKTPLESSVFYYEH